MKKFIVMIIVVFSATFISCDKKEKAQMQQRIDSLNNALVESKKIETTMNEVGVMLDSIDKSRQALKLKITEGISYGDYIGRLQGINDHVKKLHSKIISLEDNQKHTNAIVKRLKGDLEAKSKEIISLQLDVAGLRDQNKMLFADNISKDSIITTRDETVKAKTSDVSMLEAQIKEINDKNQIKLASLYFAQAQALETAANRTRFAPNKKKATKLEALELYKLSLSLGNKDAQPKIEELERKTSSL